MEYHRRTPFGARCRELRISRHLKQRQVAEAIGIAGSTYGNLESAAHRVIAGDKAVALADFHKLAASDREVFLALWEATPLSGFTLKRRERWRTLNERRSLAKRVPALELSLCLVLGVHIGLTDSDKVCVCQPFGGDPCEVCEALTVLGLDTYTTREVAIDQLSKLQGKLEAARAAAGQAAP